MSLYQDIQADPSSRRVVAIVLAAILVVAMFVVGTMSFEKVDANEILVVQDAVDGELHWYATPGLKPQWFGRAVIFPKVMTYEFEDTVRFNEGGHAAIIGSIQFRLPTDSTTLSAIYTTYGSAEAFRTGLLETVTDKSIFMTGPLLSSTESYAEKRSNLIYWIEDQIRDGVYRTIRRDMKTRDPITGEEKTVTVAEIALDANGHPQRQEPSQLITFGIVPFNFAVARMPYDTKVEQQIQSQQENIMAIQRAATESRRAEQQALTAEQQGRANATKAKWDQEALKATAVTEAQQRLEVAQLDAKAALQERAANIARGEGEAARRRLVMNADGALSVKVDAWLKAQQMWATAIQGYQGDWVPQFVMGGGSSSASGTGATTLIDLLTAKTAQDLGLDMRMQRNSATATRAP